MIENTRPKCLHCGQHIRAKDGEGAIPLNGLQSIHYEILDIMKEFGGQAVTSMDIFTVFIADRRNRGLPLHSVTSFGSRISELVGTHRLKFIRSGNKVTYTII